MEHFRFPKSVTDATYSAEQSAQTHLQLSLLNNASANAGGTWEPTAHAHSALYDKKCLPVRRQPVGRLRLHRMRLRRLPMRPLPLRRGPVRRLPVGRRASKTKRPGIAEQPRRAKRPDNLAKLNAVIPEHVQPPCREHVRSPETARSLEALRIFEDAICMHQDEMWKFIHAMTADEMVNTGEIRTGWDEARMLTWSEFCEFHDMDGDRFKRALEPLMDLETPASFGGRRPIPLRAFGDRNALMKIDILVGGRNPIFKLWVQSALFLARHLDYPMPACMHPVTT